MAPTLDPHIKERFETVMREREEHLVRVTSVALYTVASLARQHDPQARYIQLVDDPTGDWLLAHALVRDLAPETLAALSAGSTLSRRDYFLDETGDVAEDMIVLDEVTLHKYMFSAGHVALLDIDKVLTEIEPLMRA